MDLLKLVIVDDEPIILRGLLETYDWQQMGFIVVGSALNAERAIEVIKQTKPHLVLTDIRMKQITGLMLIEKVKEFDDSILFIVISAYRDFEYAQKACEIGAFSYLLKPIDDDKLNETMKLAYKNCIERIQNRLEHENWQILLSENGDNFLHVLIQKYLQNNIEEEKLKQAFSILNKNIDENNTFVSICVDIDISYKIINQLEFEAQRFKLFECIEEKLKSDYTHWYFEIETGNRLFILDTTHKKGVIYIKKILENISSLFEYKIISAISNEYSGFEAIKKSYNQAIKMYEVAAEAGATAFTVTKNISLESESNLYSTDIETAILNSIRKNNLEQLKKSYINFIYSIPSLNKNNLENRYIHRLMVQVEFMLQDSYGFTENIEDSFSNFYSSLKDIKTLKAIDICYKILCNVIEERKNCTENQNIKYFSDYMSTAIAYIEQNLNDESLSIVTVASQIYLNPVYFGRIFKSTQKVSFKQYILKKRIELAKKLIVETQESIASICERVGIPNPSYFTQLFKQYTGLLPTEYKKEFEI